MPSNMKLVALKLHYIDHLDAVDARIRHETMCRYAELYDYLHSFLKEHLPRTLYVDMKSLVELSYSRRGSSTVYNLVKNIRRRGMQSVADRSEKNKVHRIELVSVQHDAEHVYIHIAAEDIYAALVFVKCVMQKTAVHCDRYAELATSTLYVPSARNVWHWRCGSIQIGRNHMSAPDRELYLHEHAGVQSGAIREELDELLAEYKVERVHHIVGIKHHSAYARVIQ